MCSCVLIEVVCGFCVVSMCMGVFSGVVGFVLLLVVVVLCVVFVIGVVVMVVLMV